MIHSKGQETALKNKTLRFTGNTFRARNTQKSQCRALDKKILLQCNDATVRVFPASLPKWMQCIFPSMGHSKAHTERKAGVNSAIPQLQTLGPPKSDSQGSKTKDRLFNTALFNCRNLCCRMVTLGFSIDKRSYWTKEWKNIKAYFICQVYQK